MVNLVKLYIGTSHDQKVAFWKGNPRLFQGCLGWSIVIIWPGLWWDGGGS